MRKKSIIKFTDLIRFFEKIINHYFLGVEVELLRLVGISFQSLPVALREEFSLTNDKAEVAPVILKDVFDLSEIVCLYTCNRIEFYYTSEFEVDPVSLFCYLSKSTFELNQKVRSNIYHFSGENVTQHLFSVICGLKSMVVGESQIFHQIKKAFQISSRNGCVKKDLNLLFQYAFKTAKEIHRLTQLDKIKNSVSSLAVDLADVLLEGLEDKNVLIIGTGETAELTRKTIFSKGIGNLVFMSKTQKRAEQWSDITGQTTMLVSQLPKVISAFDLIISCTSCETPIISRAMFNDYSIETNEKTQVLIDLGVPRNIDASVGELPNKYLRNIDDLKGLMDKNHELRMCEVQEANLLVKEAVEKFKCRKSLNAMFLSIHEDCIEIARNNFRKALSEFQHSGNLENFEEQMSKIIFKSIETPLNSFRDLTNRLPASVLNETIFKEVDSVKTKIIIESSLGNRQKS